jgi:carbon-monoxide dehydrogenase large subunit
MRGRASAVDAAMLDHPANTDRPEAKTFGRSMPRVEDSALLRGVGRFVDDLQMPGLLQAAFVRSPHAHAAIRGIDASAALALPGVHAVLTRDDIIPFLTTDRLVVALPDRCYRQERHRIVLAGEETVHVGEPIAIVIAENRYVAEDAASLVEIDFDPLPAASDCRAALADGAPPVHLGAPHNLIAEFDASYGDPEAAFRSAAHVFRDSFWIHRGCSHALECRGCLARHDPIEDRLTVWISTQTPLVAARMFADLLGRDEKTIRVVAPDVGGGFGPKLVFYPEEVAVAVAALRLGRPVKWIEDRREHFVATTQERDQYWEAEVAADAEGRILGIRASLIHDHGAYTARGLTIPQGSVASLTLAYDVPAYHVDVKVALTNKVPVTPVRGAGQPQGVFVMERLLDGIARELKLDRAEVRRKNLIAAEKMPYKKGLRTRGGFQVVLDSGNYPACQAEALARSGWDDFPARQAKARQEGRYLGIGLANYVEGTGRGPFEAVTVRMAPTGKIHVYTGATAIGQGTRTMLAQIVAEQLGGDMSQVIVTTGDSAGVSLGFGGFNSRQTVIAGSSAHSAAVKVRTKILQIASHRLEVAPEDLDIAGDSVHVRGVPEMKLRLADVVQSVMGTAGFALPAGVGPGMEATEHVIIDSMTYANGSVVAEVEVDIETGGVDLKRMVFVHDAGRIINPMIVDGQVTGATAHGIGNALFEWMGFGEDGQPLTTNFADYLLVSAPEVPSIELAHRESPTYLNPLGVKGVGESGTLPTPAAIVSAVEDALSPFGVRFSQAPLRPADIVAAVAAARAKAQP